jgi:hypothetical protein
VTLAVAAGIATSAAATETTITAASSSPAAPWTAVKALAGRTIFTRTRFVNRQGPALKVLFVERGDGFLGVGWIGHFDKGEAAGTARRPVLHDVYRKDAAGLGKKVLQIVFGATVGEVANK